MMDYLHHYSHPCILHNLHNTIPFDALCKYLQNLKPFHRTALLLADEPTGALDSKTTEDVLNIFDELHKQGITLVLVTHEDHVATRAKKIAYFNEGKVIEIKHKN